MITDEVNDDTLTEQSGSKKVDNRPVLILGNPKVLSHLYCIEICNPMTSLVIEHRYHAGDHISLRRTLENLLASNIHPINICATDMNTDSIMYMGHNLQKNLDPILNYTQTFELEDMRKFWDSFHKSSQ